jgi:hypothetical protein
MAAPTTPRVEATSISTTTLRWVYGGTNNVGVYRSTDGIAYAVVATVLAAVLSYDDTGLDTGTKYWYKLSDDDETTFSDIVTVVTHACPVTDDDSASGSLPKFPTDDSITADRLNELIRRLEAGLAGVKIAPDNCIICPTDGAVVVDCRNGCNNWTVIADQDINSVSINWCEQFNGSISFVVPPDETWGICGFPAGFGFTGDECIESPISGGPSGNTATVGWNGTGNSGAGGVTTGGPKADPNNTGDRVGVGTGGGSAGPGGGGCTCIPGSKGELAIKSCNPDNSILCATTKSLKLIACGGKGPYTWSNTGTITRSATTGNTTTVTPAANAGSAVAGDAYSLYGKFPTGSAGTCATFHKKQKYKCDDTVSGAAVDETCGAGNTFPHACTSGSNITTCGQMTCVSCTFDLVTPCSGPQVCPTPCVSPDTTCKNCVASTATGGKLVCDTRSAGMVSGGCSPCGVSTNGATVSVTDALGTVVTIVVVA